MKFPMVTYILLLLYGFSGMAISGPIHVQIETQKVMVNKPFTVMFRIDNPSQQLTPDFSKLENDFIILSTGSSARVSLLNGKRYSELVWSVVLQTDKKGTLTLPPIDFGGISSSAVSIQVHDQVTASKPESPETKKQLPVFLEAKISNDKPFINESVIYTVNLYRQRGVFINASYQQQEVTNALVVPLNKSQENQIMRNGREYVVESMRYVIYPNDKGLLKIKAPSLKGTISDIYMRRFQTDANTVRMDVQPIPVKAGDFWLPANKVHLSQKFSKSVTQLKRGDAVVRTIKLRAEGLPAQLIPDISLPAIKGGKIYEEAPEREKNIVKNGVITGTLVLKATYLLNQSGEVDIPPIQLRWFNIKTRQFETVTLPKMTWQVESVSDSATGAPPPVNQAVNMQKKLEEEPFTNIRQGFQWRYLIQLLGIFVVFFFFWLLYRMLILRKNGLKDAPVNVKARDPRQIKQQLKQACRQNNPVEARRLLICWAVGYFNNSSIINLTQISAKIGHQGLSKAIVELNQALYAPQADACWYGKNLWGAWQDFVNKKLAGIEKKSPALPPIFPDI
jgi:hypothetical protein